jgi:hypothetical protein
MEAIRSSETSIRFQQPTWCYIPEDSTLHNHRCENLKSYQVAIYSSEMLVSTYQTTQQHIPQLCDLN